MTFANGANDNKLCLWDAAASSGARPRCELTEHQTAVKVLALSPHEATYSRLAEELPIDASSSGTHNLDQCSNLLTLVLRSGIAMEPT